MPAEFTYSDGTADFFEAGSRRSAWHREGHLIPPDREITIPEALKLIHGDYEVVRQPTFYPVDAAFQLRKRKHAYGTVRTDTGKELGSVGRSYTVLPSRGNRARGGRPPTLICTAVNREPPETPARASVMGRLPCAL